MRIIAVQVGWRIVIGCITTEENFNDGKCKRSRNYLFGLLPFLFFPFDDLSKALLPPPDKPRLAKRRWFSAMLACLRCSYSDGPCFRFTGMVGVASSEISASGISS